MQAAAIAPATTSDAHEPVPASAWYALFVLSLVLMFAMVDRAIIALLAEPIKKSLQLSDLQLGLMQGTGIAVFTALAAFPMAWLADRFGRRPVLALSILVWSASVVGCGLAQGFGQMLLATAMVGAGEAALAPITYALIAELFHPARRQLANSVFVVAGAAGGGLAMVITGQLVMAGESVRPLLPQALQGLDAWRISFLLAALPAPLMMLLVFTIRQIRRAAAAQQAVAAIAASATTLRQHFREHGQTLLSFFFGIGFVIFAFGAVGSWFAVICIRIFGQTPAQVGNALGLISIVSIAAGFGVTTLVIPRLARRLGAVLQIRVIWISVLACVGTSFSIAFATSATQLYAIQAVQAIILAAANMLYPTALQGMAPAHLRGRVVAIQGTINVALGALASPTVGFLSDRMSHRADSLLVAASGTAVVGLLVAAVLLRWCERGYAQTMESIARAEQPVQAQA